MRFYPFVFSLRTVWIAVGFSILAVQLSAAYRTEYVVAQDGSGDFRTLQDAIDDCKSFPDKRVTIRVMPGEYWGQVTVPPWNTRLSIVGEGEVTLINDAHFKSVGRGRNSTFMTATLEVLADDFIAENLRVVNAAGPIGQALALRVEGDRSAFYECRLEGNQDTLYVAGGDSRMYLKSCYIEGTTDFIFGEATAFFEDCEIRSKAESYITAASTREGSSYGLVFKDCSLTAEEGVGNVYLGRPWRQFAKTVFVECELGRHIRPEGWQPWGVENPAETVFYAELDCTGPGADRSERVGWSHGLASGKAKDYAREVVLGDWVPKR